MGLHTNTIKKHHDRIKAVINQAIVKGLMNVNDNPYIRFKPRIEEPSRVFLSKEELVRIENLEFKSEDIHLERIRDIFLIETYTGLRFSDVTRLTAGHFIETEKGLLLQIKAQKTKKTVVIPLYYLFRIEGEKRSKPELLISKYLKEVYRYGDNELIRDIELFKITNQYNNRKLKEIGKRAGISKRISSHVARRTFATQLATKVKAPVLQRLLQHSRPDMTNIYIQLSNRSIEQELEKIEWS